MDGRNGGERQRGVLLAVAPTVGLAVVVWVAVQGESRLLYGRGFGDAWATASPAVAVGAALAITGALGAAAWLRNRVGSRVSGAFAPLALGLRGPDQRGPSWARPGDVAALAVGGSRPGRLCFGRLAGGWGRGPLLAGEERASLIVLGPSQSGKTSGLAVPAILEWSGPVVATSVKTDLVRDTLGWRSGQGVTWVYDPTGSTGLAAAGWSPLAACGDWQRARKVSSWLCGATRAGVGGAGGGAGSGSGDDDFWFGQAAKLLAPHLLAAAIGGCSMGDVVRWIDTQEEAEVTALLDRDGEAEALMAAGASWGRDDRTRSSVYATAELVLEAFADPTVVSSSLVWDIDAHRLLDGGSHTLYACAPGHEQQRLRPVFSTLLHQLLAAAYDRVARHGRPLDPPLLIVLDEAANIAPLRDLDSLASTAAGHGIQLVTVWQDLAQIQARYGDRAGTVVNNHRAKVLLSGISDPPTLDYASRLLGERRIGEASITTNGRGERSTTRAHRERRLMTDAELRQVPPNQGVLVYGHLPPARFHLRPWYRDRTLRQRGEPGLAAPSTG